MRWPWTSRQTHLHPSPTSTTSPLPRDERPSPPGSVAGPFFRCQAQRLRDGRVPSVWALSLGNPSRWPEAEGSKAEG